MKQPRRSSRRAFLAGRSALDAIEDAADGRDTIDPPESVARQRGAAGPLELQVSRRAMACEFAVFFDTNRYQHGTEAAMSALDLIESLEQQMTVYRGDSEISTLNARAAAAPVRVEPRLFRLLERAVQLSEQTGGAFDVTSGPLSKVWGFHRREGRIPTEADLKQTMNHVGSHLLQFDPARRTIGFARQGVEINLGSIGKGYALDRAAEQLKTDEVRDFLIHGGASSIWAGGSASGRSEDEGPGWLVGIRHPARPGKRLVEVLLHERGLATSGSAVQHFHHRGKKYGHIIDPRSGWPAETNLSSTVIAPTAAEADALATAFFVMTLDEIEAFCGEHTEIGAIVVTAGERKGAIETHEFNLDEVTLRWDVE